MDQYRGMAVEELCDWADALFKQCLDEDACSHPRMIKLRNILPFVVDRLRDVERQNMPREQRDIMNEADRLSRRGEAAESFRLRMQAESMNRPTPDCGR